MPHNVHFSRAMDQASKDLLAALTVEQRARIRDGIAALAEIHNNAPGLTMQGGTGQYIMLPATGLQPAERLLVYFRPGDALAGQPGFFILEVYRITR